MYQKFTLALYARLICAGDIAARIYQPGYSGYRGERQKIYLVFRESGGGHTAGRRV
tara:strand:- start:94 stop:261 length:168 start_codon:yes stop_codon:yes gene_type:complete